MPAINPIRGIEPGNIRGGYDANGLGSVSDLDLFALASEVIAQPRRQTTSFILHAPLELIARYRLLPLVHPEFREAARLQIVRLAANYQHTGEPVTPAAADFPDVTAALQALTGAIDRGNTEQAQSAAWFAGRHASPEELRDSLGLEFLKRTSAAAHSHIFLYLIARLDGGSEVSAMRMLPGFIREMAQNPSLTIRWTHPRAGLSPVAASRSPADFQTIEDAFLKVPLRPFKGFIAPIVQWAEKQQLPEKIVAPFIPDEVSSTNAAEGFFALICRVAALTMLEEDPQQAKYGWTHALTLPYAVWEIAPGIRDIGFALRVAATYLVGFRAAIGRLKSLTANPVFRETNMPLATALQRSPAAAAATAWHAGSTEETFRELATQASIRTDAHLVKYTLACHDAALRDPVSAAVYRASAASLAALWMREE